MQDKSIQEQASKTPAGAKELTVFSIVRDSACADCGAELWQGELLFLEKEKAHCLACADLDHLLYLPSGDAALTRRAKKYSTLSAVVLRFSRARKRYERQGLLVEEEALLRAEKECLADADLRAARRERSAAKRLDYDAGLAARMTHSIRELFPHCPPEEAERIAAHTSVRSSGRVGRTAEGKALVDEAVRAAVIAAVRHRHTRYDELLMRGVERSEARHAVRDRVAEVLERWS